MSYYEKLKAIIVASYKFLGYWGYFQILGKLDAFLGRVFSAIYGEWQSGLWNFDQSQLGPQLGVETETLQITFGLKTDSPDTVINIG